MKLSEGELRPGVVLAVKDNFGTIVASVPGLFSAEDKDCLPPISPFPVGQPNTFTTPKVGDEVWVLFFHDNNRQLFWIRKDQTSKNNGLYNKRGGPKSARVGDSGIQGQPNCNILASIENKSAWATIYFADGSGWIIQNQDIIIQLDQNGKIIMTNGEPHCTLEINDDGISLGSSGKSAHPACHGDRVADLFDNIIDTLAAIAATARSNPYTAAIGEVIEQQLQKYQDDSQYIVSDYVTLD